MKRSFKIASFVVIFAMLLVACSPAATQAPAAAPTTAPVVQPTTAPVPPTEAPAAPTTAAAQPTTAAPAQATTAPAATMDYSKVGPELAAAFQGKYKGTVVNMAGPFTDQDTVKFNQSVKDFEDKTGINILYAGSKEFEASIRIQVEGGTPPDIVDFPQPGLLASFASSGKVLDAGKIVNPDWLKQNYSQAWLDLSQMKNKDGSTFTAGIWARANVKGIVFYPKKAFDAAGYKVPTTWDELVTLENQIISDGDTPWCIGMESGAATGWTATDWIENLMLRTTTPENYDKWVAGTLKFDSPEVKKALSYMTPIWFNNKMVYGGTKSIATTNFGDAPKPMFDNPPKCWLHNQGNFVTSFFPSNLKSGVDYDVFYLPPIDPTLGKPLEVAGDIYGAFNDRPEVRAVLQYFTLGESLKTWIEANGAIGPMNDADVAWYTDPVTAKIAGLVKTATAVRFDGSDSMPAAVGTGSFWKEMTTWVSTSPDQATAEKNEDTILKAIDATWPAK
jgi:alpha-glucoside transport system substrate-binding protein